MALDALRRAQPPPCEILVVDDGSSDETAEIALSRGARVVPLIQNRGAAAAKNRGGREATGDVILFTDSDIVPPPDAIARVQAALSDRACDGIVGLLDEDIPARNWASQFKNLWMIFTYRRFAGAGRIGLFYTSAAAIRRMRFLDLGGFDEAYTGASIAEDTEFGQRAWGAGLNLILEPRLQVVHLKTYTWSSVLREDFWRARALLLMWLRKRGQPFFTSVPLSYQLAVPTAYLALGLGFAALVLQNALMAGLAGLTLIGFYLLNLPFLRFLQEQRGLWFAIRAGAFLPLDALVVGTGMARASVDWVRGHKY